MVLKRRKIYHNARKTRADRDRTRLACNVNPARLDSALAVANFETRKTAASRNRACQRMNEPEEYRQCGIELRSARKLANNCAPCPKKCVGTLGSEWKQCVMISAATCSNSERKVILSASYRHVSCSVRSGGRHDSSLCCKRSKGSL